MNKTGQRLSVIIPTYYRYPSLGTVLALLSRQTLPPDEVIVADQTPSADRPTGFYERFSGLPLRVLDLAEPSLSESRNRAAGAASGDVLLFMDDDMEFGPTLLERHVEVMAEERVDVVFGAISTEATLPETFARNVEWLDPVSLFLKTPNCRWNGMVLVTSGANTLIKRDRFFAVGGYDQNLPRMEDIDLGYRLFRTGAKMFYSEKPFSRHMRAPLGGTRKTQRDQQWVRILSKVYLHQKHFPGWATRQLVIKEALNALTFRDLLTGTLRLSNVLRFYSPLQNLWRLRRACREATRLLNASARGE
jgi:GT2 family glycosyltransferase